MRLIRAELLLPRQKRRSQTKNCGQHDLARHVVMIPMASALRSPRLLGGSWRPSHGSLLVHHDMPARLWRRQKGYVRDHIAIGSGHVPDPYLLSRIVLPDDIRSVVAVQILKPNEKRRYGGLYIREGSLFNENAAAGVGLW
jgi:hypothetical protein